MSMCPPTPPRATTPWSDTGLPETSPHKASGSSTKATQLSLPAAPIFGSKGPSRVLTLRHPPPCQPRWRLRRPGSRLQQPHLQPSHPNRLLPPMWLPSRLPPNRRQRPPPPNPRAVQSATQSCPGAALPPAPRQGGMPAERLFEPARTETISAAGRWWPRALAQLLVCGSFSSLPAFAQGLSLGGVSEDRPIEISADSGIEWQQDAQVYIAHGNAMAKRGATEVHADTLTAHYRRSKGAGGETEIYRLNADGHVTIKGERQTVVGDQAVYDVDQQIGVVTGKALRMTTATDVVTARDSLEWYDQKQIAVARGDAVAVREAKRIRADVLTAHLTKDKPKPGESGSDAKPARAAPVTANAKAGSAAGLPAAGDESSRISRVDAQGNVLVSTATDIGRGDYGVYNADTGIVTLLGNVTVTRGPNAIRGQYAVVDLNNNISRMMTVPATPGTAAPRVEGLFVRQDNGSTSSVPLANTASGSAPGSVQKP